MNHTRLSDVMAVLSAATDLCMGQPINHALTTCVVAMRLGDALGFDDATGSGTGDTYVDLNKLTFSKQATGAVTGK